VYDQGAPRVVPTSYELIGTDFSGTHCEGFGDHFIWIEDVLQELGYSGECLQICYDYLLDMRTAYECDWAFGAFVANSLADANGMFPDGMFAAAWLGGPFFVMTYDNQYYGIAKMDAVAAHETGHILWALDQYQGCGDCDEGGGYLDTENQNADVLGGGQGGCLINEPSIMRGGITPYADGALDPYGAGQLGWWDGDEDGLPDVIDTTPAVFIDAYSPDPTHESHLAYSGVAWDLPAHNQNPASWNPRVDMTVNTISSVQYRVDEGAWSSAIPLDGAFDDSLEYFVLTTDSLPSGTHVIEITAFNSVCSESEAMAADTVTITSWVGVPGLLPGGLQMLSIAPNPSSGVAVIHYYLPECSAASIGIYTLTGRRVRALRREAPMRAGQHIAVWDGRDDIGFSVGSGVYFCRVHTDKGEAAEKLLVVR